MMMEEGLETPWFDNRHEAVPNERGTKRTQERVHSSDDDVFLVGTPPPLPPPPQPQSVRLSTVASCGRISVTSTGPRQGKSPLFANDSNSNGSNNVRHGDKFSSVDGRLQETHPPPSATSVPTTRAVSGAEPACYATTSTNSDEGQLDKASKFSPSPSPNRNPSPSPLNIECLPEDSCEMAPYCRQTRPRGSIFDDLLFEIYDQWHDSYRDSFDSDTFTEYSSAAEVTHYWTAVRSEYCLENEDRGIKKHGRAYLQNQSFEKLQEIETNLRYDISQASARLVRQLKRRDHRIAKLNCNCDLLTAFLQASSLKRRIDTRIKFSIEPPLVGENAYEQWVDAMKGVARLPLGIPEEFRRKVWLSLADHYIKEIHLDWEKTVRFAFNDRCNPDDNKLGLQIVKDLHRTGCRSFSGHDNEEERAVLKRVLLAYARWNKNVGYCQGFNVIAALLLDVFDRREDEALKVMVYLIDHVLPDSYFANNLRALSVDMAVFRDLLHWKFPSLSQHLDNLQKAAQEEASGAIYEPPLTNVFTMQWFLTLFATCLPKKTVLRLWDSILLEGSEILLRAALVIWNKLSKRILMVGSADEFYTLMAELTQEMVNSERFSPEKLIKAIYSISPFPFPQLSELREKYTYNIRPFSGTGSNSGKKVNQFDSGVSVSDDDLDEEDMEAIRCFTGLFNLQSINSANKTKGLEGEVTNTTNNNCNDISMVGPGIYGTPSLSDANNLSMIQSSAYMERMTTDLSALKKQYQKLRQRQAQAHIILSAANTYQQKPHTDFITPTIESPKAMNHLFIGRNALKKHRNRFITAGPRIACTVPSASFPGKAPSLSCKFRSKSFESHFNPNQSYIPTESQKKNCSRRSNSENSQVTPPNTRLPDALQRLHSEKEVAVDNHKLSSSSLDPDSSTGTASVPLDSSTATDTVNLLDSSTATDTVNLLLDSSNATDTASVPLDSSNVTDSASIPLDSSNATDSASVPLDSSNVTDSASIPLDSSNATDSASVPLDSSNATDTASVPLDSSNATDSASIPLDSSNATDSASVPLDSSNATDSVSVPHDPSSTTDSASVLHDSISGTESASVPLDSSSSTDIASVTHGTSTGSASVPHDGSSAIGSTSAPHDTNSSTDSACLAPDSSSVTGTGDGDVAATAVVLISELVSSKDDTSVVKEVDVSNSLHADSIAASEEKPEVISVENIAHNMEHSKKDSEENYCLLDPHSVSEFQHSVSENSEINLAKLLFPATQNITGLISPSIDATYISDSTPAVNTGLSITPASGEPETCHQVVDGNEDDDEDDKQPSLIIFDSASDHLEGDAQEVTPFSLLEDSDTKESLEEQVSQLFRSPSLDSCNNLDFSALSEASDEVSSLASFFETNGENFKVSGDDEKTLLSSSPMPSELSWETVPNPSKGRFRSHSCCSPDTLSPTEKIGIKFGVARINGDSWCHQNMEEYTRSMRRRSTRSECQMPSNNHHSTNSDSQESLNSFTTTTTTDSKYSSSHILKPKPVSQQTAADPSVYLNKHCALNGLKLGMYKPSMLVRVNKKQKPSLQRSFTKS